MGRPNRPGGPWLGTNNPITNRPWLRASVPLLNGSWLRANDPSINFQREEELYDGKGEDILGANLEHNALVGEKMDDTLLGGDGIDIFAGQRTGFDVLEGFADDQDKLLLLGSLQFEQLGIQQKGQDALISYERNSLMSLNNLDATGLISADIVTSS